VQVDDKDVAVSGDLGEANVDVVPVDCEGRNLALFRCQFNPFLAFRQFGATHDLHCFKIEPNHSAVLD
jgi:hypothetical protein